jgi:hypothetical protein
MIPLLLQGYFFTPPSRQLPSTVEGVTNPMSGPRAKKFFYAFPHKSENCCVIVSSNQKINLQTEKPNK